MTKQKHRKRLIRAHAAKHSQTYTTASRMLASSQAVTMPVQGAWPPVAPLFPLPQPWNPLVVTTPIQASALVAQAMAMEPYLTHFGIGLYGGERTRKAIGNDPKATREYHQRFAAERAALRIHLVEVAAAADWIQRQKTVKTINETETSYTYKHDVERWFRSRNAPLYIANGSFIAAALGLGILGKRPRNDSPNMHFAFSRVALKAIRQATREAQEAQPA